MSKIATPCVNICVVHPESGLCVGCHRTTDEIARWRAMSDDERVQIMAELPSREGQHKKRRGGRTAKQARGQG